MSLNDLPVEILGIILEKIPLIERVRCRLVNKKWLFVVDHSNPKCLVLSETEFVCWDRWAFTNEPVKLDNLVVKSNFKCGTERVIGMRMFSKIQQLYFTPYTQLIFKTANDAELCFNQLVQLRELKMYNGLNSPLKLSLPKLEVLEIDQFLDNLILDTPNLIKISYPSLECITCLYPEKVKWISQIGPTCEEDPNLDQFVNLEFASIWSLTDWHIDSLANLPKLKELHFQKREMDPSDPFKDSDLVSREKLLEFSYRLKRIAKSKQLRINHGGFYLNEKLKEISYSKQGFSYITDVEISAFLQSLDNLSDELPAESISFERQSFNELGNRMPEGFLRRFVHLKHLHFYGEIESEERLVALLTDCRFIETIEFDDCGLTEQFYRDTLPREFPFLKKIILKRAKIVNFDFLFKFHTPHWLTIDPPADAELIKKLFRDLKSLHTVEFERNGIFVIISKGLKEDEEDDGFELIHWSARRNKRFVRFESLDDLLSLCFPNFHTLQALYV